MCPHVRIIETGKWSSGGLGGKRASAEMVNTSADEHTRPTWSFKLQKSAVESVTEVHNKVGSGKGRRGSENEETLEKALPDTETALT